MHIEIKLLISETNIEISLGYGMILLCLGALINWLGISEPVGQSSEPIRYLGVACIMGL